jgi:hypothetical protein
MPQGWRRKSKDVRNAAKGKQESSEWYEVAKQALMGSKTAPAQARSSKPARPRRWCCCSRSSVCRRVRISAPLSLVSAIGNTHVAAFISSSRTAEPLLRTALVLSHCWCLSLPLSLSLLSLYLTLLSLSHTAEPLELSLALLSFSRC